MKKSSRRTVLYELMAKPDAAPVSRRRPRRTWWSGADSPTQRATQEPTAGDAIEQEAPASAEATVEREAEQVIAARGTSETASTFQSTSPTPTEPPVQSGGSIGDPRPPIQVSGGAVTIRWTSQTIILLGGCCAALVLGAYWIGRASVQGTPDAPYRTIAAPGPSAGTTDETPQAVGPSAEGASRGSPAASPSPGPGGGVEQLLRPVAPPGAAKNEPAASGAEPKPEPSSGKKELRLWIESIRATTAAEKRVAMSEAAKIQEFLRQESLETDIETVSNGIIIVSREAFPAGAAGNADREALQLRVQRLGRLYQQRGGQYSFKSCFWK